MKEKEKIYELFRQNEHKLTERPSSRAWERLEGRLDSHHQRRRQRHSSMGWFRYGGMVAAVLLLVATASILMMQTKTAGAPQFATTDMETSLQDKPVADNDSKYLRIVQYQNEYHKDFGSRIVEQEGSLRS